MRTTTTLLLCSAVAACAPVGGPGLLADAGDGTTSRTCDSARTINRDITITDASGFDLLPNGCWDLNGKLTLRGSGITSLTNLGQPRNVGSLELDNTALTKFDVTSPVNVTGDIIIHNNAQLADISELQPEMPTSVLVENNAALPNVGGLADMTQVGPGPVTIDNNGKLATVDLSKAMRLGGGLSVSENAALATLKLDALTSVGNLTISHNAALAKLSSLAQLNFIHGVLTVENNDKLTSLGAMSGAMTSIDGGIIITGNALLADLGQLTHAGFVGVGVTVTSNPSLDYCQPQPFTCCTPIGGRLTISGNLTSSCQTHSWCWATTNSCPYSNY
jgi:hypothetical protein